MARMKRFTFLCDSEERQVLVVLARGLRRSQSDAIRWLIREAAMELIASEAKLQHTQSKGKETRHATATA